MADGQVRPIRARLRVRREVFRRHYEHHLAHVRSRHESRRRCRHRDVFRRAACRLLVDLRLYLHDWPPELRDGKLAHPERHDLHVVPVQPRRDSPHPAHADDSDDETEKQRQRRRPRERRLRLAKRRRAVLRQRQLHREHRDNFDERRRNLEPPRGRGRDLQLRPRPRPPAEQRRLPQSHQPDRPSLPTRRQHHLQRVHENLRRSGDPDGAFADPRVGQRRSPDLRSLRIFVRDGQRERGAPDDDRLHQARRHARHCQSRDHRPHDVARVGRERAGQEPDAHRRAIRSDDDRHLRPWSREQDVLHRHLYGGLRISRRSREDPGRRLRSQPPERAFLRDPRISGGHLRLFCLYRRHGHDGVSGRDQPGIFWHRVRRPGHRHEYLRNCHRLRRRRTCSDDHRHGNGLRRQRRPLLELRRRCDLQGRVFSRQLHVHYAVFGGHQWRVDDDLHSHG